MLTLRSLKLPLCCNVVILTFIAIYVVVIVTDFCFASIKHVLHFSEFVGIEN
jgi:hypothetical protein